MIFGYGGVWVWGCLGVGVIEYGSVGGDYRDGAVVISEDALW